MSTGTQDLKTRLSEKAKPVTFRRTLGLAGATTLGVGALMGAGLYVLVGIAAAAAGPGLWAAYAICGGLTFLSVLMFAELSFRMPISGGGYAYAYRSLGSFWGFMVGWLLAAGSIFACALYAVGFSYYVGAFLPSWVGSSELLTKGMATTLVTVLSAISLRGGEGGDRVQRILTWGNVLVLVVLVVFAAPGADLDRLSPPFPRGAAGVGAAVSVVYISFFGYQLIANNAEETRDARRNVPRAMILSMAIAVTLYLLVAVASVAVVDWQELARSDAPLNLVAARGLGPVGFVVVGLGGILASGAALNGTLFSQGRQLYAMSRDGMLPRLLGRLMGSSKVPVPALVAGAGTTVAVVVLADLAFIAKAANFALLSSMLPVSVALARLHKDRAAAGEKIALPRRALPWAALVANAGLLLTLDSQSLLFGGIVVGAGCALFLTYTYSSEKRTQAGLSVTLSEGNPLLRLRRGARVLVPMANPATQDALFAITRALLPPGGEVVVLNVVPAASEESLRQALGQSEAVDHAVAVLGRAIAKAESEDITFRPVVRAARSLAEGLVHAATEEGCQLIVMGFSLRDESSPSELLDEVTSNIRSDVVCLAIKGELRSKRVGVALGSSANLPLMTRVATAMATEHDGEVRYMSVVPEYFEQEHLAHARQLHVDALSRHGSLVPYETELVRSDNPLEALIERSEDLDLLVIGSAAGGGLQTGSLGTFSAMVANQAHCSVVIVRQLSPFGRLVSPQAETIRDLGEGVLRLGARGKSNDL